MDKNYCSFMMWMYFSGFAIKQYKYNFKADYKMSKIVKIVLDCPEVQGNEI